MSGEKSRTRFLAMLQKVFFLICICIIYPRNTVPGNLLEYRCFLLFLLSKLLHRNMNVMNASNFFLF